MSDPHTETLDDLAAVYKRIAIKWLMWDGGKSEEDAQAIVAQWPVNPDATEAVDVATFIVEQCSGG